jgi:hypothetical protein
MLPGNRTFFYGILKTVKENLNIYLNYLSMTQYIKFMNKPFKKKDIIRTAGMGSMHFIVINDNCKDQWWRKLFRWFGFKVFNPTGYIKVKPLK